MAWREIELGEYKTVTVTEGGRRHLYASYGETFCGLQVGYQSTATYDGDSRVVTSQDLERGAYGTQNLCRSCYRSWKAS